MQRIHTRPLIYIPVDVNGDAACPICEEKSSAKEDHLDVLRWHGRCFHAINPGSDGTRLTVGFADDIDL
jgi:hypothetical protein